MQCIECILLFRLIIYDLYSFTRGFSTFHIGLLFTVLSRGWMFIYLRGRPWMQIGQKKHRRVTSESIVRCTLNVAQFIVPTAYAVKTAPRAKQMCTTIELTHICSPKLRFYSKLTEIQNNLTNHECTYAMYNNIMNRPLYLIPNSIIKHFKLINIQFSTKQSLNHFSGWSSHNHIKFLF